MVVVENAGRRKIAAEEATSKIVSEVKNVRAIYRQGT
jgi:hypothetical protein